MLTYAGQIITLILVIGTHLINCVNAQSQNENFLGLLLDAQSHEPIAFAHVIGSDESAISDHLGYFSVKANIGDTIQISHVNYERYALRVERLTGKRLIIYLFTKDHMMKEIVIRNYMSEDELKEKIVEHEIEPTIEEINATNNVAYSNLLFLKGYVPEMNSLDNFKNYIQEPKGVTFFSTGPSRGLIRSLKKLSKTRSGLRMGQQKTTEIELDSIFYRQVITPRNLPFSTTR